MTRQDFLKNTAAAGAAYLLGSMEAFATAMPDKKIRIGLIGCGSVSGVYLPHLSKCAYAEVVSLCDIIYERAQKRAAEFKVANTYPSIEKMLAGVPFDLLVNTTDMQEHEYLNKTALTSGKHVWSEKPMANSYKAAKNFSTLRRART